MPVLSLPSPSILPRFSHVAPCSQPQGPINLLNHRLTRDSSHSRPTPGKGLSPLCQQLCLQPSLARISSPVRWPSVCVESSLHLLTFWHQLATDFTYRLRLDVFKKFALTSRTCGSRRNSGTTHSPDCSRVDSVVVRSVALTSNSSAS